MTWQAIGALGEILGAVAVFGSLFYLALQIRGSTKQSRAVMVQSIAGEFGRSQDAIMLNPQLAEVMTKFAAGDELSAAEYLQGEASINRALNTYLAVQSAQDNGQLDPDYYRTICQDVARMNRNFPGWGDVMRKLLEDFPDASRKELFAGLYPE